MRTQIAFGHVSSLTHGAHVRFVASVEADVTGQFARAIERRTTNVAQVRRLTWKETQTHTRETLFYFLCAR